MSALLAKGKQKNLKVPVIFSNLVPTGCTEEIWNSLFGNVYYNKMQSTLWALFQSNPDAK